MRKAIVGALFLCFGMTQMNAQVTFTPGIRGGLNLSTITQTDANYKPDFYIGAFGAINFTKRYTLQPEINYSRQGANNIVVENYNPDNGNYDLSKKDVSLSYISLSVMNKFFLVEGFHVMIGPTLDFVVGDNMLYRNVDVDLGANAGLGYKFPSGISVEARFKKGIVDVLDSGYYYEGNDYSWGDWNANIVFQFGISYAFDLKKKL